MAAHHSSGHHSESLAQLPNELSQRRLQHAPPLVRQMADVVVVEGVQTRAIVAERSLGTVPEVLLHSQVAAALGVRVAQMPRGQEAHEVRERERVLARTLVCRSAQMLL